MLLKYRRILGWSSFVLAVVLIVGMILNSTEIIRTTRGTALNDIVSQAPEELKPLAEAVRKNFVEYRANAAKWSFAHYGVLFGSAIFSVFASVVLKLDSFFDNVSRKKDIAATCAAFAGLLATFSGLGSFESYWRANRIAAAEMENLAYELLRSHDKDLVLKRIQAINRKRAQMIVGGGEVKGPSSLPPPSATKEP